MKKTYLAIDLKSFYASVECHERALNPLTTNLVVADASRTNKTICLAVSPSLKKYGLSGRSRLFEVEAKAAEILRRTGKPLEYITAVPRMSLYIQYSSEIYSIYLKYFSHEDIHVYSIDEVFIDATSYLDYYHISARELTQRVIQNILQETGITATAGIAPNLFLCKVAMDIVAKHVEPDENGVRIAEIDEQTYREKLWNHQPLTDFWRIGRGIEKRLKNNFMYTMGDIARRSLEDEDSLYKIFGIDAEILIDHAWGYEPCSLKDIKGYKSQSKGVGSGQVLQHPYTFEKARIIVREMAELLVLDMFEKNIVASSFSLLIGYDRTSLENCEYKGEVVNDGWGRMMPKPSHGNFDLGFETNSSHQIVEGFVQLFEKICNPELLVRRVGVNANNIISKEVRQIGLFDETENEEKENRLQQARLDILRKFGKNALLKGTNLQEGAMTRERNKQIGGHKA